MTTGKTIALARWTFVSKVMSLLFNMLSKFVITFLPRSKCLLISWLQSPSVVILEPKKIKSVIVSSFPSSICHGVMGSNAIKIGRRSINSLTYADYTSLMAESEEETKEPLDEGERGE